MNSQGIEDPINELVSRLQSSLHEMQFREERLLRLNQLYSVISRINEIIVRVRDIKGLSDEVCRIACTEGPFRAAFIGLIDPDTSLINPVSFYGDEEKVMGVIKFVTGDLLNYLNPTSIVINEGRFDVCNDIENDPRMLSWRNEVLAINLCSFASFPLKMKGVPAGVFTCFADKPDFFNEEITGLLLRISDDISFAIEFIEKEEERRLREEEASLLQSMIVSISDADDVTAAIEIVLQHICEITGWVYGEAWVPRPDSTVLECTKTWFKDEKYEKFKAISEKYLFQPGIGLPGRVWSSKKPEWVKDVSVNGSIYLRSDGAINNGLRTGLAVPIIGGDEVLAVLVYYKDIISPENEQQVKLISAVTAQLSSVIQKKRAEIEKERLEAQLRHSQKMEALGQLTGGIAHDINNLLTVILGSGHFLHIKLKDQTLKSHVEQILSTSEKAAYLTKSLLAFSRKQPIDIKIVVINDVITGVEKLLRKLIGEHIKLKVQMPVEDITIEADRNQLEQAFLNLVTNSRDAMPEGGLLSISATVVRLDNDFVRTHSYGTPGDYVLITVSDTGIGMDESTKEKIFEPFFTTKEVGKGTGLGLSIVYGIIKQHNGYINLYSESGKGTDFKIYLPVVKSEINKSKPIVETGPSDGTETILVAEDEADVRRFVSLLLEGLGYKVILAADGDDAINKFNENRDKIHLLVLDVIMPKKNGKDVYNIIREMRPDIKVLFTSGYDDAIIQRQGILEKGHSFISKPFVPTELLKKIREILDKES